MVTLSGLRSYAHVLAGIFALGCGGGSSSDDSSKAEPEEAIPCAVDDDCDDGNFCNGIELCGTTGDSPVLRCLPTVASCLTGQSCAEEEMTCTTDCDVSTDADGDGADAVECGGDDCDDSDANRYPGNIETCDAIAHDEDCDPTTYGFQDLDNDGSSAGTCCNVDSDGTEICGPDCNDASPLMNPGAVEACDGFDNNCNGETDEGVERALYVDKDGDGYGNPLEASLLGTCGVNEGLSPFPTDCDDTNPDVKPGALEVCDGLDTNCDGVGIEDYDGDGHVDEGALCVIDDDSLPVDDCDDEDAERHPDAAEICNGIDDDCDGTNDNQEVTDALCSSDPTVYASICRAGECHDIACEPFRGECNNDSSDGCEADFLSDVKNCGSCGSSCFPGATCADGVCDSVKPVTVSRQHGNGNDNEGANACVLFDNGYVGCWGLSLVGQTTITEVPGIVDAVEVTVSPEGTACAIRATGNVVCWGERGDLGRLGDGIQSGTSFEPVTVVDAAAQPLEGVTSIALGRASCALAGGDLYCWGSNLNLQEIPLWDEPGDFISHALLIPWVDEKIVKLGRGFSSCVVVQGGDIRCWGSDKQGQLGNGGGDNSGSTPRLVTGISNIEELVVTSQNRCARKANDKIWCWGKKAGDGTGDKRTTPVQVATMVDQLAVTDRFGHQGCFLTGSGAAFCWGAGGAELGNGIDADLAVPNAPVRVAVDYRFKHLDYSCGITLSDELLCWGPNAGERLGTGDSIDRYEPSSVSGLTGLASVHTARKGSCVRHVDGTASCWGDNQSGQLGTGNRNNTKRPTKVLSLTSAIQLDIHRSSSCAILSDGEIECWGTSKEGQLGTGEKSLYTSPAPVPLDGAEVIDIDVQSFNLCVTQADRTVRCSGRNDEGQLGHGPITDSESLSLTSPVELEDGSILDGVANQDGSCVVRKDGTVWCWGRGDLSERPFASQMGDFDDAIQLVVSEKQNGEYSACVRRVAGQMSCWGHNNYGQLADASRATRLSPVTSDGHEALVSLQPSVDTETFCALDIVGRLSCWGQNKDDIISEQVGDWTSVPTPNPLTPNLRSVSTSLHICGLTLGGELFCWGGNGSGQVGNGTNGTQLSPYRVMF